MAEAQYQSLYRRFRPQRFADVRGQDHVTRALRNAVRENRIGHAYLFSGPRGTGKTSTARILAKVLNCANPQDGEPCGVCDNCLAVQRGQVVDWLLEQDAASKSKVDDMRDLLDRVPLGTSGNRKVIILDEVHMLSQGAENALLKTLEEPPSHVVFVLATTDPQKVRPTIRSRTQHFEFHLLPPDVMTDHIRHVIEEADLPLGEDAVNHVVRAGGGSARDTLSALDQVAALGEVVADHQPVDAILDGLVSGDAGAVLVAVADAMATGREPRTLGEALIARLRDAFLAVMGVADQHLPEAERTRASELGEKLGPAGLTRALEVLGDALIELSRKPDPRIVVEVALIRLVRPDADNSTDALMARIERLEQTVRDGGVLAPAAPPSSAGPGSAAAPPAAPAAPAPPAGPGPTESGPSSGAGRPADGARAALAANRPTGKGKGSSTKPTASAAPLSGGEADPADASVTQVVASDVASDMEASGGGVAVMATPRTEDPPASAPSDAGQAESPEAHGDAMPTADPASAPTPTPPGGQGSVAPASAPTATGSTPSVPTAAAASSTVPPEASAESPTAPSTPTTPSAPAPAASTGSASASPTFAGPSPASAGPAGASSAPAAASAASPAGPPKQASPPGAQASATAGQAPSASTAAPSRSASQASSPTSASSAAPASSASGEPAAGAGRVALERAWPQILAELPISVRSKWRGGRWAEPSPDGGVRFAVDNSWHQKACEEGRAEVEKIVAAQLGNRVQIQVVVEGGRSAEAATGGPGGPGGPSPAGPPPDADDGAEDIADVSQLADANDVATGGVDLLLREFGGELVEEDPR